MESASGLEFIEVKNDESLNDYRKEVNEEPNLLSVIGFVGFGVVIFLSIIELVKEPFLAAFTFAAENDGMPGLASAFGLVFAVFWFICAIVLLSGLVFKICYKFLKGI